MQNVGAGLLCYCGTPLPRHGDAPFKAGRHRSRRIRLDKKFVGYNAAQDVVRGDDDTAGGHRLPYRLVETAGGREVNVEGVRRVRCDSFVVTNGGVVCDIPYYIK